MTTAAADAYAEALARYGVTADELPALLHMFDANRRDRWADVPLIAMVSALIEHLAEQVETGGFAGAFGQVDRAALAGHLRHLLILTDRVEVEESAGVTYSRNCEFCGRAFVGRADAKFCTDAHRQAAYRARKAAGTATA